MNYILEADIYEGCSQLNMLEYSLECIGIDENEFVNEGFNIKEKVKNIGKTILGWIDNAKGFLKKVTDFVFRKSKVADVAYSSAEKKAEQAVNNMDKVAPEQAEAKATKVANNITKVTTNLNRQMEAKDKEIEKSTSTDGTVDVKIDTTSNNKADSSSVKAGRCTVKTLNTQKVGEFLAQSQQNIHAIASCMNDMDKIFKSIDTENFNKNDTDRLSKKDDSFSRRSDAVRRGIDPKYSNPAKVFLEDEIFTIKEVSRGKWKIHKEIIQVINNNKKYIDSVQDRLEKIISQVDKELSKVKQKVEVYTNKLDRVEYDLDLGRENSTIYVRFRENCRYFQREVTNSNYIINTAAQFVIKYKTTLIGYLSAIAAGSSSEAA